MYDCKMKTIDSFGFCVCTHWIYSKRIWPIENSCYIWVQSKKPVPIDIIHPEEE